MKLLVTTHNHSIELNLYDVDHYSKIIEGFHKNKGLSQKDIFNMLVDEYEKNKHHDYPQKIFEIGTVFKKDSKMETGVKEFTRLGMVSCHGEANYTEARQMLDALLTAIGCDYDVFETDHDSFIKGRVARVSINGRNIAYIGEIKPEVLRNFDIDMPVAAFELNLSELF